MRPSVAFARASFAALALAVPFAGAAEPDASAIDRLVRRLDGDRNGGWESAGQLLDAWGEEALPALRRALHSHDPEVRRRAEDVLPALEVRLELDLRPEALRAIRELGGALGGDAEFPAEPVVWVNLCGKPVTDAVLAHLARVRGLEGARELFLDHTAVTDAGLAHLRAFRRLYRLDLLGTAVTDEGLAHLAALPGLLWLDLGRTRVTDAGVEHLKQLPDLRILNVRGSGISDAGIAQLQQAIPGLRVRR
jgi:hypothetical protein